MDNIPSEAQFGGSLTDNSTEEHKVKQDTGDDCETDYIHHPHPETRTDDLEKMLPDREQENNHQEITENTACENMDEETDTLRQCADHPFSESMCGKNPFEDDIRNSSHCSDCPPEFRIGNPFEDDSSEVSAVADDHAEERLKRSGTNPFEETEGEVSFSNGSASEGTPASGKNPFEEETDAETTAESAKFEEDETDAETSKQRTNLLKAAKENEIVAIDQLPTINEKQITDKDTSLSVQRPASCVDTDRLAKIQVKIEDVPEVRTIVLALLEMAFDKQEDIATTAVSTLRALGEKQPATVLRTLSNYLTGQGRPTCQLRLMILNVVDSTINPAIEMRQLDRSLASCLTKVALEEIVSITDPSPQIQSSASNILVSIGTVYCKDVIGMLSARLQPNSIPHQYILDSLASLATQNIYGVVPHLKSLLIALVDMLPQVRGSTMRSSFSSALAKFSEALIFYLTNIDRAPDPSIRRDWFADEITRAFDVLHTIWLPCKAPKLCQDILEALGYMSQLLPIECLDEMASKVLPSLLNAYKGPVEPLYVSRCLALFLEAYLNVSKEIVDAHLLDMLLNVLFLQVSASPDFSQPSTVKNHYEVLRCFEIVGRSHLERLVNFLLLKMEPASEKNRVASLIVVKHLVNSLKVQLQPHIALMQQHLKPLIGEQHNRVRKALAQTVVAMAVQGFLDVGADSSDFVSFLLKLCALPPSDNVSVFGSVASHTGIDAFLGKAGSQQYCAPGSVTNAELRQMSENVIHLLATTQPLMERILWPHLLVYTVNKDYNRAMTVISRALAHLVTKKHEENDTLLPETGRPSTAAIIARFLVLVSCPVPVERTIAVLQFLLNFSAFVAKTLYKLWQDEISPLISKPKTMALVDRFSGAEEESWRFSVEFFPGGFTSDSFPDQR